MNRMMLITMRAGAVTWMNCGMTLPPNLALTMPPPTATKTSMKVPNSSENSRRYSYLAWWNSSIEAS